jgi:hypothetical protein
MLWPPESPRRGTRRTRRRSWVEPLVTFTVLLALAGACCRIGFIAYHPFDVTYPTPDCRIIARCAQTLPMCGPDLRVPADGQPVWYWDRKQPRNAPALLGFQPLLPTRIVGQTFGWDSALLVGPQKVRDAPLLREVYAKPPHWYAVDGVSGIIPPTPEPARPSFDAIYVLDETTAVTDPLVDVEDAASFEFAAQRDVTFGAASGTLYYLAPIGGMPPVSWTPAPVTPPTPTPTVHSTARAASTPALLAAAEPSPVTTGATPTPTITVPTDSYFALALVWRVGSVRLRLLAVSDFRVVLNVHMPAGSTILPIHIWAATDPTVPPNIVEIDLLETAASIQPYTGCG